MALDAREAEIHTGFPGIIESWDPDTMTASIQPSIMAQVQDQLGEWTSVPVPLLQDCPVHFQSGGGFTSTFPIKKGDEVWVSIAERCIDAWWESGGVQDQSTLRMHDYSDGFFFPKVWSQPNKLSPPPHSSNAQLRSDDGTTLIEMTPDQVVNVIAPGGFNVTALAGINLNGVTIDSDGNLASPAMITAVLDIIAAFGTANFIKLLLHTHGGVQTGLSHTAVPDPGT